MTIVIVLIIAAAVLGALRFVGKVSGSGLTLSAAMVMLGLAGYAMQGQPGLASAPAKGVAKPVNPQDADVETRKALLGAIGSDAQRMAQADAYMRIGRGDLAFNVLKGGVDQQPRSVALWIALANALMLHNAGVLVPAADHAYRRAIAIAPDYPMGWYFYGMALARNGKTEEARLAWQKLAGLIPANSPKRAMMMQEMVDTGIVSKSDVGL